MGSEMCIRDSGSSDPRVYDILESYKDSRLRVIHQQNMGFTHALRRAIEESDGEFIAIQGAGDISFPGRLERQVQVLQENKDIVGVAVTALNAFDDEDSCLDEVFDGGFSDLRTTEFLAAHRFTHGTIMFRRNVYESVGGYRTVFTLSQDTDLFLRLSLFGCIRVLSDTLYLRRIFSRDGVTSDILKVLQQSHYAEFAR